MKKILLSLFVLFLGVVAKSQNGTPLYPVTQNLGGTSTLIDVKGGQRIAGAFVLGHYADTTAANAVPYVKNFANGLITTDTNLLWIRSYNAQQWYFVPNTGNPATGDTLYWRVGGNALIPMQQQGIYTGLGSKDSTPLFFITNYQRRLVIPPNGVNRSAGTANKCLVIDTVTKFMYYTDCSGGGGSTPTLQQVLTAGSTLTTNHTVDAGSTIFKIKLDEDQDNVGFTGLNYNSLIGFENGNAWVRMGNPAAANSGVNVVTGSIQVQSTGVSNSSNLIVYSDSIKVLPALGRFVIDSLNYTLSTTGKKIMLRDTASGLVQNIDPALLGGVNIYNSDGTFPEDRTVEMDGNRFIITDEGVSRLNFNNGSDGSSYLASKNDSSWLDLQNGFAELSGRDSILFATTLETGDYRFKNIPSTTSTVGKKVILGDTTQNGKLYTIDPLLLAQEAANFADTTNFKPVVINTTGTAGTIGKIYKATYWPGGGGGSTSPAGNYGNLQINRNGAFATPASDSLDFESATGLSIKGDVRSTGSIYLPTSASHGIRFGGTINIYDNTSSLRFSPPTGIMGLYTPSFNAVLQLFRGDGNNAMYLDASTNNIYTAAGAMSLQASGSNVCIGMASSSATARLHLPAGTATASTAPLKLTSGTNLTTPESGAIEFDGTNFYSTNSTAARRTIVASGVGTATAAANDLTLPKNGNVFHITGATQINAIVTSGWPAGSEITLIFDSTPTVKNNTAGGGGTAVLLLAGGADFSATANDVLKLVYDGTSWYEVSRSVN